jgi:hypothetical protein
MSAQKRYTTLLKNTTSIYAAAKETRTDLLHAGLNEIVAGISPNGPADWGKVHSDSAMLLSVWTTKEDNHAAQEVRHQLLAFLEAQAQAPVAVPSLHISDPPTDKILHIKEYPSDDEGEEEEEEEEQVKVVVVKAAPAPAPAKKAIVDCLQQQTSPIGTSEEEVEEEVEEVEEEEVEEEEVEEEVEEEEVEEEVEEEEEEEEEVEEEEEEDGLEVEPYTYRGRKYWRDSSGQVYENLAGDEVGDHIGDIVNDKLQFL